MKNEITPFCYGEDLVRVIQGEDGEPWWVAKDVCKILDVVWKGSGTLGSLDDDERGVLVVETAGGRQELLSVNESGLYTLIIRSNKPEARPFRRWVTHEVLPAIRKTGAYQMPNANDPRFMDDAGVRRSGNMYFPMAKLVESADKYLEGKAALKALNYFTGMPVDDLLAELDEKQLSSGLESGGMGHPAMIRDALGQWMFEQCEVGEGYSERASVLYRSFCDWAKDNWQLSRPVTLKTFGVNMARQFERHKSGVIHYLGIRLAGVPDAHI